MHLTKLMHLRNAVMCVLLGWFDFTGGRPSVLCNRAKNLFDICSAALWQLDAECIIHVLTPLLKMNTDAIFKLATEIQSHYRRSISS